MIAPMFSQEMLPVFGKDASSQPYLSTEEITEPAKGHDRLIFYKAR